MKIKKEYELNYRIKDCLFFKRFKTKKELDKFIRKLPKELKVFEVFWFKYENYGGTVILSDVKYLTENYVKETINKVILK